MSYIITAEINTESEPNRAGRKELVKARILSERGEITTFDINGNHFTKAKDTMALCETLIESGFFEFEIRHSY